jgi:hypothetical protein
MASPSEILGLFTNPQQYQQQQQDLARARAMEYAKLDPFQQANTAIGQGAYGLAGAIGGALGGVDPQLQKITQRQQLLTQLDRGNPESYKQLSKLAAQNGDPEFAMALAQELRNFEKETAQTAEYKGIQAERDRKALESKNIFDARVKALKDSGVAKDDNEAKAIASNDSTFAEAMGLTKLSPDKKAEKAMYAKAAELYPNDPIAQFQYVEQIKAGTKPATDAEIKDVAEAKQANIILESRLDKNDEYLKLVSGKNPKVTFGPFSNIKAAAEATGFLGEPSENTKAQDDIRSYMTEGVNAVLNAAKGVQAKDDALRAQKQIEGYLKLNTNAGAEQALKRLKQAQEDVLKSNQVYIESRVRSAPKQPTQSSTPISRQNELLKKASPEQLKLLGR